MEKAHARGALEEGDDLGLQPRVLDASQPALERGARYPRPPRELSLRDPCAVAGGHEVSDRADGERTRRLSAAKGVAVYSSGGVSVQCPPPICATFGAHRISTNHGSRPASRCTCASTFAIAARVSEIPLAYVLVTSCTMGAAPFHVMV